MSKKDDLQPKETTMNTDGGTGIQGNVNVEGDFAGRDRYNADKIVIYQNADGSVNTAIPNQLPRQTARHFTGRTADLAWIEQNLAPSKTLVISGPGGMGKTTLSIEAVCRMAADDRLYALFPGGNRQYAESCDSVGKYGVALSR